MNKVTRQYCGSHTTGEDIYLFTLENTKGTVVSITNYGATITAFKVKNAGGITNDIVLGFEKPEEYLQPDYLNAYPWMGCAIGRYANRIKNARFDLNGKEIKLEANQGTNMLHGGTNGFDKKIWELVSFGHHPYLFLELKFTSINAEAGFPGTLATTLRFELTDDNELSYTYHATTDKATPVNLTHHSYFNLDNGTGTILNHRIRICGSQTLDQDDDLSANGNLSDVKATAYDFTTFQMIGKRINEIGEYDKSFVVKEKTTEPTLVAEAGSVSSGLTLQVFSTEPVVHFYTGKWIPELKGKEGKRYGAFSGFCLETHIHPNAVNIPHFPNSILQPGEVYSQKTVYKVLS